MTTFTEVQDRLLRAKRDNPGARWPECLLRQHEERALRLEVSRARHPSARQAAER